MKVSVYHWHRKCMQYDRFHILALNLSKYAIPEIFNHECENTKEGVLDRANPLYILLERYLSTRTGLPLLLNDFSWTRKHNETLTSQLPQL
jgi:hypothetical protein